MKHFQIPLTAAAATLLLAASCSVKENRIQCQAPVTVAVSTFSLSLSYGSYKMVVIAHEGEFPITLSNLSEASFGSEKPKDTFLYSQDLTIENSDPANLSATLSRIITRLIIESTDSKPANVKDVRITLSKGGTTFSPVTGFAANDAGFVNSISLAEAATGTSKLRTTFFIGAIEENLDVKAEVLDEDATVLNTINVPAVPFKRNRATFLKGSLYSVSSQASFAVETGFEGDIKLDF